MRRYLLFLWIGLMVVLQSGEVWGQDEMKASPVLLRDRWGVPHVFAEKETDGFFELGFACAEDRLLQMELLRRRATGRLAELFGEEWVRSDRTFRIAGIGRYCAQAYAHLPSEMKDNLRAYAAGVNAYAKAHPDSVRQRFVPLGTLPEPWTPSDCLAAWMGFATVFDGFVDERANSVQMYREFQQLVAQVGEAEALTRRGMVIDDAAAVVPESEMAKDKEIYARLKAMKPTPGFGLRSAPEMPIRFSHAWAVDGTRSTTGKPLLESDPQTSVNNPPLWYEFHLSAGGYDVRGIGAAGCPALLVGFNRHIAWGATALGVGCTVTFIEKLSDDGRSYLYRGEARPFDRRLERIEVKGGSAVIQEVLTNRHGFVFNALTPENQNRPGEAYVSHYKMVQDKGTSVRAMLEWMRASNWDEFRAAMEHYYSPGIHVVYADTEGNIGYQTLAHVPLTKRTPRMALEGWTGEDEVLGRIPLSEMPSMLNPDAHFISHANNLPVGAWYPYDLGLSTGGIGDTARSIRLRQLLTGERKFSIEDFETTIHRDDVQAAVAALLPVGRKVAEEDRVTDTAVRRVLDALEGWDMHYRATHPAYPMAMALAGASILAYRGSVLSGMLGGGEAGVCHLARLLAERFAKDGSTPQDPSVREYLIRWLRLAGGGEEGGRRVPSVRVETEGEIHSMPYQQNGPLHFPPLAPELDLVSPPLTCGQISTIWSQPGNSYTQIVDLSDVDNSRSLLPPGISEAPESPFHTNQMALWVKGTTHPAPLSREKVESMAASRMALSIVPYDGPDSPDEKVVESTPEENGQFIPAIPQTAPAQGGR